jgi:hypothetical protein
MLMMPQQLEDFERDVSNWRRVVYETLRRLFDPPDEYANDFDRAGGIFMGSYRDTPQVKFNRAHERLRRYVGNLQGIVQLIAVVAGAPPRPARQSASPTGPSPRIHIEIHGGNVSNLNLGEVVGNIESRINSVTGPDAADFADAMKQLVEVAQTAPGFTDEARQEAISHLDAVSEEADRPPGKRRPAVVGAIVARLAQVMALAEATHTVWQDYGPAVMGFFGIAPR